MLAGGGDRIRALCVVCCGLAMAGSLVACADRTGDDAAPDGVITLEVFGVASLSGDGRAYGVRQADGATLAVEELAGEDLRIELTGIDDESTPDAAQRAIRTAIDAGASVILGPTSSESKRGPSSPSISRLCDACTGHGPEKRHIITVTSSMVVGTLNPR